MKFKQINIALAAIALSVVSISCQKDKEDPLISIETPANHSDHDFGSSIEVKATFTDDQDLKSYKVFMGDEDGEHMHMFHFEEEAEISGESYSYTGSVQLPDSASMEMAYLHFEVKDMEDKLATERLMLHFHY